MALAVTATREAMAVAFGGLATHAALFTTAPSGATPGTEVAGSGYARQPITWNAGASDGTIAGQVTFTVPAGQTVRGAGLYTALTGGTYRDGGTLPETAFPTSGPYTLTINFSQG